jgi:hypothetical protein
MAIFNLTALTPTPVTVGGVNPAGSIVAAGSEAKHLQYSSGGLAHWGVVLQPSGAGAVPFGIFCRGGKQGTDSQLTDAKILGDSNSSGVATFGTHTGLSGLGVDYCVVAPDYREGEGLRNGASASEGTVGGGDGDNFGVKGEDIDDILTAWSARYELTKADDTKTFAYGSSAGCMRLLMAMEEGLRPDVCILRAPLMNIADWEPNRNGHLAIPDFEGDGDTAWEDLTRADKVRLTDRSPMQRMDKLPVIPYLLIYGEDDTTVPRGWIHTFRDHMEARGAEVQVVIVPGGTHSLTAVSGDTTVVKSRAVLAASAVLDYLAEKMV